MSVPFRSALASALLLAPTLVGAQHARVTADDYARA
jgi:hypothetical protein